MIRRYTFNAPAHHQFEVGGRVYQGGAGDEIELDDSLAVDPRLVAVPDSERESDPAPDPSPDPDPDPDLTLPLSPFAVDPMANLPGEQL